MLFTDAILVSQATLAQIDSELPKVATGEGIAVDGVGAIADQVSSECAIELMAAVQTFGGLPSIGGVSWAHNAAVLNTGYVGMDVPRVNLSQIVVDGLYPGLASPLQRWVQYRALALFYRDASGRKGKANDRYEEKRENFNDLALKSWKQLKSTGLPFILAPMACPGAAREVGSGSWTAGNVAKVAGVGTAGTFYVAITYVDGISYQTPVAKGNAESGPSAAFSITTLISEVVTVDITSLNPPDGTTPAIGISQGIVTRRAATGWNVYVGATASTLYLQNASPIPVATKTYTLPGGPVLSGYVMTSGQYPDANITFQNMLMRA